MREPSENVPPIKYKWPWFVAAFVLLGFVITVFAVWLEVRHIEQERDVDAPLPAQK